MRTTIGVVATLLLVACMQKQADGTYRLPRNSNASKAGAEVKKATDKIAKSDVAKKIESGVGKVATKAGEKLQKVGEKVQADAAKHH